MRQSTFIITAMVVGLGTAAFAGGHEGNPAVKARNAHMGLYGFNLGILSAMAKGEAEYNAALASEAASDLATLTAFKQSAYWPEGTAQGEVDGSRAKSEIWIDTAGWNDAQAMMAASASALSEVAGNGLEALQAGMADAGKACGTCHKAYRGPRN